jgi:GT2 family glycosyltransferase
VGPPLDARDAGPPKALPTELRSDNWLDASAPRVAALICTYQRSRYLAELLGALEGQDLPHDQFEVVVVDDGSTDGTWEVLTSAITSTELPLLAVRHTENRGPAAARNQAATRARAPVLAFTDDDCLPSPGWLSSVLAAIAGGADIVQGQVRPRAQELEQSGPWDHTIWVGKPSPFFETCNVSYRRGAFERVGGFDECDRLLTPESGRGFGEDADLAWRVIESGGRAVFAPDALVHHRCAPTTFRRHLRGQRHTAGFPALARRSPLVSRWLQGGVFLSQESAAFDAALLGLVLAARLRRAWPLLSAVPWFRRRWRHALSGTHGDVSRALLVLGQYGLADFVTLISLLEGSIRHRRIVL